ncbi:Mxr2 protein [Candida orthopsilosis Co 90-125]|uniref:Peptide-methionine (R)-S-oxide reductase n=1 Tax=Candida orthopsilosis (strain 90-125) TaxID=1136231 RepID=H8X297_CANO9|nr:Mxr2 protein [Candida orthopsilosis Co 90-125]CCG22819.1 Mxr2 protein [Candida orthopsilosis Co 90-125]
MASKIFICLLLFLSVTFMLCQQAASVLKHKSISSSIAATRNLSFATKRINHSNTQKQSIRKMSKSDNEWRAILSPEQFYVLREKGTEPPGSGKYNKTPSSSKGVYECVACHNPLYKASTKFDSGCGWPAFYDAIPGALNVHTDKSHGMTRNEITCAKCGGHLGHVFKGEGFNTPTDERHCVNSISLHLNPDKTQ